MDTKELHEYYGLTEEQIAFYQEQGYIKLKHVFSPEILAYLNEEISREVHQRNPLRKKPLEEQSAFEQAFIQIGNLWRTNASINQLIMSTRLGKIASDLLGVDSVRLYHDQALYKEPSKKIKNITPWHADQFYWPLSSDNTITAWIPLQEVTLDMGPLAFSKGSHKLDFGREVAISNESEALIQQQLVDANLQTDNAGFDSGEISFHGGWTYHRAGANTSDNVRAIMTIIYMENGITLSEFKREEHIADRDAFLPKLEPGDVAATELNPIIYKN